MKKLIKKRFNRLKKFRGKIKKIYTNITPSLFFTCDLKNAINNYKNPKVKIERVLKNNVDSFLGDINSVDNSIIDYILIPSNVGLIAYFDNIPCAVGVEFHRSSLVRALHLNKKTLYVGEFFVKNEYRGNSIYPIILCSIMESAKQYEQLCLEVEPKNISSIRGVQKAGFTCMGLLKGKIILGKSLLYIDKNIPER